MLVLTAQFTNPIDASVLFSKALPITLNGLIVSPVATALAVPLTELETSLYPFVTAPVTLTGVLPVIATNGCESLLPAPAFMAYAG